MDQGSGLPQMLQCPDCHGTGEQKQLCGDCYGASWYDCGSCNGKGFQYEEYPQAASQKWCKRVAPAGH